MKKKMKSLMATIGVALTITGSVFAATTVTIGDVEALKDFATKVNSGTSYEGDTVALSADLDLAGVEWTPVGVGTRSSKSYTGNAFKGTFDGGNHTISGLTITSAASDDDAVGLFGVVDGGTVKNLKLGAVNINVASSDLAGCAIGLMVNNAKAENITVGGSIVGNDGVGGIAGRLIISGTIYSCTNNASVTSSYGGIGGIVGKAYYEDGANTALFASVDKCVNNGTITAPMYVGGIVGLARANVIGCINNGVVVGGTQTGGIVGQLIAAGTVSNNENNAKISGKNHLGGIIGDYSQSNAYTYYNVTIADNINRGELAATEQRAAILGCNNIDGFTAMTASGNVSFYNAEGLELFGNPEDMVIDQTNMFNPAAKIGDTTYATLADAFAAVKNGETITLLSDLTILGETFTIADGKTITLDMNGKKITATDNKASNVSYELFYIYGGLTVTGNGTIELTSTSADTAWAKSSTIFHNRGGVLTIENGTFKHLGGTAMAFVVDNNANERGDVVTNIGGGTLDSTYIAIRNRMFSKANGNKFNYGDATLNISGGTITGTSRAIWGQAVSNTETPAIGAINITGGTIGLIDAPRSNGAVCMTTVSGGTVDSFKGEVGELKVTGGSITGTTTILSAAGETVDYAVNADGLYVPAVAEVNGVKYVTLKDAVAAVADGGVIMLIANETFTEANRTLSSGSWYEGLYYVGDKSFTINLNGFTITQNGAVNDYLMLFKNEGSKANTITLQNGTIDAGTAAFCAICTSSVNTQKIIVNLENVSVIGNNSNGSVLKIRGGTELNVKAGTKITGENSYLGIECVASTVNIYDGAEIYMNGTGSYNGCLVGVASSGTVNVYDGYGKSVSGGFIAMTSGGTINVFGGEWIANKDGTYANDNKSVLIAQSDNGVKSIVNVSGGIFKGGYNCYGNAAGDAQINITGGNFNSDPATYVVDGYLAGLNAAGTYDVAKAVAKIGEQTYTTIAAAIAAAQNGDTVVISAGEYAPINISYKNITIQGTVGDNGELLTVIKGGNPAITGHSFNGTIKDIKVVDAFKVMYAEPAGNVTVDNIYVTGATYGLHLVACAQGFNWTIKNSYMDLAWANSFGVDGGDAAIVIKDNEFASTNPYYPDYGAIPVNTFLPNVTVEGNVFGENTKIKLAAAFTDTSKINISKNYHADGVENAFADDSSVEVSIRQYYTDSELQNLVELLKGAGTEADPFVIATIEDLKFFRDEVNGGNTFDNQFVKMAADIDLNNVAWTPIGSTDKPFKGTFDGNYKKVSNLVVEGGANQGFFGYADNCVIKNLNLENVNVKGTDCVGAVAGQVYSVSIIDNCHVSGNIKVEGQTNVGGIVGKYYVRVTNSSVIGDGVDTSYVKGVYVASDFEGDNVGGIMGHGGESNNFVGNTVKNITISGTRKVGGIVGTTTKATNVSAATVENVVVATTATAEYSVSKADSMGLGGLVGHYYSTSAGGTISENTVKGVTFSIPDGITAEAGAVVGNDRTAVGAEPTGVTVENLTVENITGATQQYLIPMAAQVGTTKYMTLSEAAAVAQSGDEIALLNNATVDGTLAIPAGVTIKSNGHTITGSIRMLGDLELNGPLTITGGLWVGKSGETLTATLSGDKLTAAYFMFQRGTYTINADIDAVYGYLSFEGEFEVNSTITTSNTNGEPLYLRGQINLNEGASFIVKNLFLDNANTVLKVKKGASITASSGVSLRTAGAQLYSSGDISGSISAIDGTTVSLTGGTYTQDVAEWCAEGYQSVKQPGEELWQVGKLPNAEVVNMGPTEVSPDSYFIFNITNGTHTSNHKAPFDLQITLNFIAKDSAEKAAENAYGDYITDFRIKIDGLSAASITADENCYLAGYYAGMWVKVNLKDFVIENGVGYPVISALFPFTYEDICRDVKNFICGIHLSDDVLNANPNLKVSLDLGLAETQNDMVNGIGFVQVGETYDYTADEMRNPVAITGPDYFMTVTGAVAAALETGDYVKLVNNAVLEEDLELGGDLVLNLGGKTLTAADKKLVITDSVVTITNGTLSGFSAANITLTGNAVLTVTDANVAASFRSDDTYYVSQNANGTHSIMRKSAFRVFITMVDGEPRIGFFKDCSGSEPTYTLLGATSLENADWASVAYTQSDDASGASELPLYWVKLDQAADDTNVYRFFKIGPAPVNEQID